MTLLELIRIAEKIAMEQPAINMIVENDVYKLDTYKDAKYGIFAFTQGQHRTGINDDNIYYNLTLFYIDRLTEDSKNQLYIQSAGIDILNNVIHTLENYGAFAQDYTFQPFNQKFADMCSGIYTNVTFMTQKRSICEEGFADMNEDYNEDFLIA